MVGFLLECYFSPRFVSISMGLCACNSAGHLSNHADLAPNHAGVTFAVSNTIVRKYFAFLFVLKLYVLNFLCKSFIKIFYRQPYQGFYVVLLLLN